ncbi:hypothetical protein EUGRSUZ_E01323 [Eucalyptus grandis]|uniref:Uncharacterized protein n=2 Tax=Eucalyptus grandis TaxID=71139 RepID=A0ACC3KUW2_EUCGR|nr:hypothetical protein EUGRSUZ_E01323 [Eucalyptus grandis]
MVLRHFHIRNSAKLLLTWINHTQFPEKKPHMPPNTWKTTPNYSRTPSARETLCDRATFPRVDAVCVSSVTILATRYPAQLKQEKEKTWGRVIISSGMLSESHATPTIQEGNKKPRKPINTASACAAKNPTAGGGRSDLSVWKRGLGFVRSAGPATP